MQIFNEKISDVLVGAGWRQSQSQQRRLREASQMAEVFPFQGSSLLMSFSRISFSLSRWDLEINPIGENDG
jgi:hypothetical protein